MPSGHTNDPSARDAEIERLSEHLPTDVREDIRNKEYVHGTALGFREEDGRLTNEPAFIVYVIEKVGEKALTAGELVPPSITLDNGETLQTDVQGTDGEFIAHASEMRSMRIRPSLGGIRIETPFARTATSTGKMYTTDGRAVVVTPRHIVSQEGEAPDGVQVNQPTRNDPANYLGTVTEWSNYTESPTLKNTNDSALIEVDDSNSLGYTLGFGQIDDTGQARLGDHLLNSSPPGGIRSGALVARNANISMTMPWGAVAEFSELVTYNTPGLAGMSGAPVIRIGPDGSNRTIVGIHVGGTNSGYSIMVPWQTIESRFGILNPPAVAPDDSAQETTASMDVGETSGDNTAPYDSSFGVSDESQTEDS